MIFQSRLTWQWRAFLLLAVTVACAHVASEPLSCPQAHLCKNMRANIAPVDLSCPGLLAARCLAPTASPSSPPLRQSALHPWTTLTSRRGKPSIPRSASAQRKALRATCRLTCPACTIPGIATPRLHCCPPFRCRHAWTATIPTLRRVPTIAWSVAIASSSYPA